MPRYIVTYLGKVRGKAIVYASDFDNAHELGEEKPSSEIEWDDDIEVDDVIKIEKE